MDTVEFQSRSVSTNIVRPSLSVVLEVAGKVPSLRIEDRNRIPKEA